MNPETFSPSKTYILTPIELESDQRYWKHRAALKRQASHAFPPHVRYEVLMTGPHDFGRKPAIAVVRGPELDRDESWQTMPFPAYANVDQRLDFTRGVYALARGIT